MLISLAFALPALADGTCYTDGSRVCNQSWTVSNTDGDDDSNSYGSCYSGTGYTGDDVSYYVTPPNGEHVHFYAYSGNVVADVDAFVQEDGCGSSGSSCTGSDRAGGTGIDTHLAWYANGSTYWLTLDDWNNSFFGFGADVDIYCDGVCNTSTNVVKTITCTSDETGTTSSGTSDVLNFYHDCGSPYSTLTQFNNEAIYSFRPQSSGSVTFRLSGLTVDQDLYVLQSICEPDGCIGGSTQASTTTDSVTFTASQGTTYYIVVEGYSGTGSYNLYFDTSSSGGCHEDCNDGVDNDSDGRIDCNDTDCTTDAVCCDIDADGYTKTTCGGGDCNDASASVHPNATETCNLVDDDCDSSIDEGVQTTFYRDLDGDAYGKATSGTTAACTAPSGYVASSTDCNDSASSIHPNASELCNGIDDDCDSVIDDNPSNPNTYYRDQDGDTYGLTSSTTTACTRPTGYAATSGDCNDTSATVYPGAPESCNNVDDDCDGTVDDGVKTTYYRDLDSDSYGNVASTTTACTAPSGYVGNSTDCNDNVATIYPNAPETCNLVDDDCDNAIDENVKTTFYRDADADGYGNVAQTTQACTVPSGYSANSTDCNDSSAAVNPGATEVCNGIDDNCDGSVDNNASNASTYYRDADSDAYGNAAVTATGCSAPSGYVGNATDCNDSAASVHPNATEVCNVVDDDCDGSIDEGVQTTYYRDADSDGYGTSATTTAACTAPSGYVAVSTDCNDSVAAIHPNATETCNLTDDDCDGSVDEGVQTTYYRDADSDGYGASATTTAACTAPTGYVANATDCNDANAAVNPAATEVCNLIDDDCDASIDEGVKTTYYADADADSYGNAASTTQACTAPSGYVGNSSDCNDGNAAVNPGAVEVCNGIDDNCDGGVDTNASNAATWYRDADGDTYGNAALTVTSCAAPSGYVGNATDCNDSAASVHPNATETCNLVDDDCDGSTDEGVQSTFYRDADSDGYGNVSSTTSACTAPTGYVANSTDCNDSVASVHPNAAETCNLVDDDCDGTVDEGVQTTFYVDNDADAYGQSGNTVLACAMPAGTAAVGGDCDDTRATAYPGATEYCNGLDDDCDGSIDDNPQGLATWYRDADGDTWGLSSNTQLACTAPSGYVAASGDCDDGRATVYPGATEYCNGLDDDCDGTADDNAANALTFYADADSDAYGDLSVTAAACTAPSGYVSNATDCNDSVASVHPNAPETCNLVDDDCDGSVDEGVQLAWYRDADTDGFGAVATTVSACTAPSGYVANSTDCNDAAPTVYPGAPESCNLVDDDCDGTVDDGVQTTFYRDADGDSYGNASLTAAACTAPAGYVANATDCDDTRDAVNPAATEVCNLLDDDCDTVVDEGVKSTWYADADADTYGNAASTTQACTAPSGFVGNSTDCNDAAATVNPGATEVCNGIDDNCDGTVDQGASNALTWYRDSDADGYGNAAVTSVACTAPSGFVASSTDCNDSVAAIHPNATETCNLTDDDCDGSVDEGVQLTWYRDADADSYGSSATTLACTVPSGYVADSTDCNDAAPSIHPGADELCNGIDDDCDGTLDDNAIDVATWYRDADSDSFGGTSTTQACSAPSGFVGTTGDCDDSRFSVHPGANETCNTLDDDCDGSVDEGAIDALTWYVDADADAYGTNSTTAASCTQPSGYVANALDCDDSRPSVHPNAAETCNLLDDDCDGFTDENVQSTFWADGDTDGYGDPTVTTAACSVPSGYVANSTDCDDSLDSVHPGAAEVCDLVDQDCDGVVDDGVQSTFYRDSDGDAFGNAGGTSVGCTAPSGFVSDSTDCDDGDSAIYPGAPEVCDGLDDDCDGQVDESAIDATTWYRDADNDGHGTSSTRVQCSRPSGYVAIDDDCDDFDGTVYPGAVEVCDGIDNDCNGLADDDAVGLGSWYLDGDADGFGQAGTLVESCTRPAGTVNNDRDCDDYDTNVFPGAPEVCNDRDDDCDGFTDEEATDAPTWYDDADSDGYGDAAVSDVSCDAPSGFVSDGTDCDDAVATTNPGAAELCNGIDDDCDGAADDGVLISYWLDADADGFGDDANETVACTLPGGYADQPGDCDDAVASTNPGATEFCNGTDDDCDGTVDIGAVDAGTWYDDVDADGFGDTATASVTCDGSGLAAASGDCDDRDAAVYPGALEVCNGVDDDCDGGTDLGAADATSWYADTDADGFGDPSTGVLACDPATGEVADATDCDDDAPGVNPGATEVCNYVDDDCDGIVDDGASDATLSYDDTDGDGWGDLGTAHTGCDAGGVSVAGDCNDTDASISPSSPEIPYDGIDQDCDGSDLLDADLDGHVADSAGGDDCADGDADVFPGATETVDGVDEDCDGLVDDGTEVFDDDGDGYAEVGGDCDDAVWEVSPARIEECNAVDDDCDGTVDEGTPCFDDDGDGATEDEGDCNDSDADVGLGAEELDGNGIDDDCDGQVDGEAFDPDDDGYTSAGGDCDPTAADVFPGADEAADGVDNDCDGVIDEGTTASDDDGDGQSEDDGDCNDFVPEMYDGATELPDNGIDDDCDGSVDEGSEVFDDDLDGYTEEGGDCDDFDDEVSPGQLEAENGVDDDCDGDIDEDFIDVDGDGFTVADGDCDDNDGWTNPRVAEFCDVVDNDCDGQIDEGCDDTDGIVTEPGKCGCNKGESAMFAPLALLIGLAGAFARRRR